MRQILAALMVLMILAAGHAFVAAQNGNDLYAKALAKERAEGNPGEAIKLYQQIVKEYPKDRALVAKALLQIGICYEKLGAQETAATYRKIVSEYGDQGDVVRDASNRLASLAQASASAGKDRGATQKTQIIRRIPLEKDLGYPWAPSPDGRYLTFEDKGSRRLGILELATGSTKLLSDANTLARQLIIQAMWAPDCAQIAYVLYNGKGNWEIHVVNLTGRDSMVYSTRVDGVEISNWSPDSKSILAYLPSEKEPDTLAMISANGGVPKVIWTLDHAEVGAFILSPDGRFLTFEYRDPSNPKESILAIRNVNGGEIIPVVRNESEKHLFGWLWDSENLLFTSKRGSTVDLWKIRIKDGHAVGGPESIKPNLGSIEPMGITRSGAFYYRVSTIMERASPIMEDVFTATLDPKSGRVVAPPSRVHPTLEGMNSLPAWSPDGRLLAYYCGTPSSEMFAKTLCVWSGEDHSTRQYELKVKVSIVARIRWSADSEGILLPGANAAKIPITWKIDARTGAASEAGVPKERTFNVDLTQDFITPSWDETEGYVTHRDPVSRAITFRVLNLTTGIEREIHRTESPARVFPPVLSPDGRWLAFKMQFSNQSPPGPWILRVIPVRDGTAHDLLHLAAPDQLWWIGWTPDSQTVAYTRTGSAPNGDFELWKMPLDGGAPQKTDLTMRILRDISFHPDGKRIAFTGGQSSQELWVMENFIQQIASENQQRTAEKSK